MYEELIGKWMTDELYSMRNNILPLWAKDIWDCRLLIVDTHSSVRAKHDPLRIHMDDPDRTMHSLGVIYGFRVKKLIKDGDTFVLSSVHGSKIGWINDVEVKDGKVLLYKGTTVRGTILEETAPGINFAAGQETMF